MENIESSRVAQWLAGVQLGAGWKDGRVEVIGLRRGDGRGASRFRIADDAFADGSLEVLERGEGGVVQELLARNSGPTPVLLLEGDTLIGAKQNRIVARTILIAPGGTVVVPVGCMERGRWRHVSAAFSHGVFCAEPSLRRATIKEVRDSRDRHGRAAHLDQGRLWSAVEEKLRSRRSNSSTSDYQAAMAEPVETIASKLRAREVPDDEIGALVLEGGRLVALELAADPRSWRKLARRTLPSTALEASERRFPGRARKAEAWMKAVLEAEFALHEALGLGHDVTVGGRGGLVGAGLWDGDGLAHLAVYKDTPER